MESAWGRLWALLSLTLVAFLAAGCSGGNQEPIELTTETPRTDVRAAMVTDVGGLGDKSFNDLSYAGLQRAKQELGVEIKVLESKAPSDYEKNITQLASGGFDPIFAVGFLMTDTVNEVAPQFTDTTFGGIDIFFEKAPPNVVGLNFKEQESAYLAGIVAGMLTTMPDIDDRINDQKVVGFVGGVEIPPVRRFEAGFRAGVKAVAPDVEVKRVYTGSFSDQQKGIEAGRSLIEGGADIVFAAGGQTGTGTFTACEEANALFIGVDSDQYMTLDDPGDTIITSALKRVDNAVFQTTEKAVNGELKGGENVVFGLAEQGVDIAPYHDWETKLPQSIKDAVEKARIDIVNGTVIVPAR